MKNSIGPDFKNIKKYIFPPAFRQLEIHCNKGIKTNMTNTKQFQNEFYNFCQSYHVLGCLFIIKQMAGNKPTSGISKSLRLVSLIVGWKCFLGGVGCLSCQKCHACVFQCAAALLALTSLLLTLFSYLMS